MKWEQLPVYLAAELLAGVLAALLYGLLARTPADRVTSPLQAWTSVTPTRSCRDGRQASTV